MTEKENLNPIDLLYRIVSAYPGMEREKAKQSLEEYLSNVPLQEGCSLSEQLPGIVSQYLWESVRPYTVSMNCPVAVDTALADYRKLNSTASPCILRSETVSGRPCSPCCSSGRRSGRSGTSGRKRQMQIRR